MIHSTLGKVTDQYQRLYSGANEDDLRVVTEQLDLETTLVRRVQLFLRELRDVANEACLTISWITSHAADWVEVD